MKWLKNILFEDALIEESLRKVIDRESEKETVQSTKISKVKEESMEEDLPKEEKIESESIRNISKSAKGKITQKQNEIWLSEKQISELFQKSLPTIHKHIANIYKENELDKASTSKKIKTKTKEGERTLTREIMYHSIEVIVAVGYRIGGEIGTDFRVWANKIVCDNYRRTGEIKM
jgi:hypothetical protein